MAEVGIFQTVDLVLDEIKDARADMGFRTERVVSTWMKTAVIDRIGIKENAMTGWFRTFGKCLRAGDIVEQCLESLLQDCEIHAWLTSGEADLGIGKVVAHPFRIERWIALCLHGVFSRRRFRERWRKEDTMLRSVQTQFPEEFLQVRCVIAVICMLALWV